MKLEGWIAVINEGWIGDDDEKELKIRLKEYGSGFPIYKIRITVIPEARAITIPDSKEAQNG